MGESITLTCCTRFTLTTTALDCMSSLLNKFNVFFPSSLEVVFVLVVWFDQLRNIELFWISPFVYNETIITIILD